MRARLASEKRFCHKTFLTRSLATKVYKRFDCT
jgi:hypothetical protein